jgi:hypothetical protein
MAGILGSYTDATCNTHNALRNVSAYACGVSFTFNTDNFTGFGDGYAVVSLQECCAKVNATVMRIPGNTGCEMQFCEVPTETTSSTQTINYEYATGTGTAAQTPQPSVTVESSIGPPERVENCMEFVYKGDLPDDVAAGISEAGSWCVARMYDDESTEEGAAVEAKPAPASWTTAAADPYASYHASATSAKAAPTSNGVSTSHGPWRTWGPAVTLILIGLIRAV